LPPAPPACPSDATCLRFDRGTLLLRGPADLVTSLGADLPQLRWDARVNAGRVPAHEYHQVIRSLVARELPFQDEAKEYAVLDGAQGSLEMTPRYYQQEAVEAWRAQRRRGVVVLPTGTGKTLVAVLAIRDAARSALVVVPTLDLLNQWYDLLCAHFGDGRVGVVGGGEFRVEELTVITYDSAYIHLDRLGSRFGLLICDEAHHLVGPTVRQAAQMALAPFRLGLTATPPEPGQGGEVLATYLGPVVYRREITELAGQYLSTYDTVRISVRLGPDEQVAHDAARGRYREFVARNGIRLGGPNGWGRFLEATSRSAEGRAALGAWREQRRISLATPQKLIHLERLLAQHRGQRTIVFSHDNETAYEVSRRFLVPVITHQTRPSERRAILQGLRDGTLPVVSTSRVLNEGVDVPEVEVGVVLSGTATVREHVQRLGRILRRVEGKHAVLYEVITEGTSEEAASQRRRAHSAYK
jgi:superfamily II DNA or RNA helicase